MRAELRVSAIVLILVFTLSAVQLYSGIVYSEDTPNPPGIDITAPAAANGTYYVGSPLTIRCFGAMQLYYGDDLVDSAYGIFEYNPQEPGGYSVVCGSENIYFTVLGVGPVQSQADDAIEIYETSTPANNSVENTATALLEEKAFFVQEESEIIYGPESGKATMTIGGHKSQIYDASGWPVNFTEVVDFRWEGDHFTLSWRAYSADIGVFLVYNGARYSPDEINYLFPGVMIEGIVTRNPDFYKYGVNISNISANLSAGLQYVGFEIRGLSGLSLENIAENGRGSFIIDNEIELGYFDLLENFEVNVSSPTTILVGNVSGKSELWLDPTIQLQTPETQTLRDTYVDSSAATTNYGDAYSLNIRDRKNTKQRAYIMFNISSIPSSVTINDAQLCMYLYINDATESAAAYHVLSHTWNGTSETATTWDIQPCGINFNANDLCNLTAEDNKTAGAVGWICWNVTNATNNEYANGDSNISFALKSPETGNLAADSYYSKEFGTASSRPYLNVTYIDSVRPAYSNIIQSPSGNPIYGDSVQANATWTDNAGLVTVYFQSNFSGSWQNYTPSVSGSAYYYTIPSAELTGGEVVGWNYWANDTSNNINDTMPVQSFTVQKAPTTMALFLNGTDGDKIYNYSESANFTAVSSLEGSDVRIWTNLTGGELSLWQSGISPLENITFLNYLPGTYLIKANFSGNENYSASEAIHTLEILPLPMAIDLMSPIDNSGDSDGNVTFYYNVSSQASISNCSIVINGTALQTDDFIEVNAAQNITVHSLAVGKYSWKIICSDLWGVENSSDSRNLSVVLMNYFEGASTDISNEDISNITGLTIENSSFGKIIFNESIDLSKGIDLNSNILMGQGYIIVNSASEPNLNKSAKLSIYNLSYEEHPAILRDGAYCADCPVESYLSGTLTFNVSHFTNYTAYSNSRAEIWDDTDAKGGSQLKYAGEQVTFYANYTNITSGEPINETGAYCNITFSDSSTNMSYNYTSKLYEFNRSFEADGNYSWNVSCNGESLGYEIINLSDSVIIQSPYLEVTLAIPPTLPGGGEPGGEGDYLIGQNKTFIIRANATCRGGTCGAVQGFIRYNRSSSLPDTNLSAYPAEPVYVVNSSEGAAQNPIYCGTLGENDSCAVNWTINATGALNSAWAIDVGFNKTRASNYTDSVSIKITKVLLMALSFNEVNFGIVNPATPSDQNPCPQNGNQYVQIDENSNDVGWLWIRGTDLQPQSLLGYGNISYNIGVENIYWHNESSNSFSKPLSSDYQMVDYNVKSGSNYGLYFWINAPGGLEAQEYRGTLYVLANSTVD